MLFCWKQISPCVPRSLGPELRHSPACHATHSLRRSLLYTPSKIKTFGRQCGGRQEIQVWVASLVAHWVTSDETLLLSVPQCVQTM